MEKEKRITATQIFEVCQQNKYIVARYIDGQLVGINCAVSRIPKLKEKAGRYKDNHTCYVSYRPCSLNEYITNKVKFF
jgi:hypothetical protein